VDENITLQLHLSQCPDCQALYDELFSVEHSIVNLTQLVPNHDFNNRVMMKIGTKRSFTKAKVGIGIGIAWLCSFLFIVFSPLSRDVFGRILTAFPSIMRLVNKIEITINTLGHILSPIAKSQFNPIMALVGLVFSIGLFYLFSKIFNPALAKPAQKVGVRA
jgi:hypothetical protein